MKTVDATSESEVALEAPLWPALPVTVTPGCLPLSTVHARAGGARVQYVSAGAGLGAYCTLPRLGPRWQADHLTSVRQGPNVKGEARSPGKTEVTTSHWQLTLLLALAAAAAADLAPSAADAA